MRGKEVEGGNWVQMKVRYPREFSVSVAGVEKSGEKVTRCGCPGRLFDSNRVGLGKERQDGLSLTSG